MPTYLAPGVYVEEVASGSRPIAGVSTSTGAFLGVAERGPVGRATLVTGFAEFVKRFGGPIGITPGLREHYLYYTVRHFFESGGSRCYVVRVAHYGDINDGDSLTAAPADASFAAERLDATAVAGALQVSAVSPGTWGTALRVRVESTSKFSLPLAQDIAAGNAESIVLPRNADVVPGSVLYLVHEVTGVVAGVDVDPASPTYRTVSFTQRLLEGSVASARTLPATNLVAYKPDFSLMTRTDLAAAVDLGAANPPAATAIRLQAVLGPDGRPALAPGDSLHFEVAAALVVVRATETTSVGGTPAMRAVIAPAGVPVALPALPRAVTRVYARDFALSVRLGDEVVETHGNLSLAAGNATDHVTVRLGEGTGNSQYIVASEPSAASPDDIVLRNTDFMPLAGAANDGLANLSVSDFVGSDLAKNGLHAFDAVEDASILAIGHSRLATAAVPDPLVHQRNLAAQVIAWVERRRDMFYIMDPPRTAGADPVAAVRAYLGTLSSSYAGIYFPWLEVKDLLTNQPVLVPPAGAVAGIFARSDTRRGVHKAPAGTDVGLVNVASGLGHQTTRGENDLLYPARINAIRNLAGEGIVVWGSRTLSAEPLWAQVGVRRLFIFLERSIQRGTDWAVFEPNDPTLWKSLEKSVRGFLRIQWLERKLVGNTEEEAFFVRCNAETNPPEIVDAGMVVTEIGVCPSRPAEFVVFRVFQFAGRER